MPVDWYFTIEITTQINTTTETDLFFVNEMAEILEQLTKVDTFYFEIL